MGMYDDWSTGTTDTLTLHYDGSAWSIVASPSFGPSSQLGDVFAVSPSDVWAVGCNQIDPNGDTATLILHYDGSSWTQVASPSPTADPCLSGVWAASPTDVWAVGSYLNGQSDATLIEHWDGSSWSIVSSPNSSDSLLYSVSGTSSSDVWAVGQGQGWADTTLVEHWDGSSWSIVTSPSVRHVNDQLFSVIALSPTNAWAVGSTFCAVVICKVGEETLIEHWDGSAWSIVPSPTPGTFPMGGLAGVSATGPDDLWAVGDFVHIHTQNIGVMIEHWSGAKWVLVEP